MTVETIPYRKLTRAELQQRRRHSRIQKKAEKREKLAVFWAQQALECTFLYAKKRFSKTTQPWGGYPAELIEVFRLNLLLRRALYGSIYD